jgi:hypothetical protein
MTNYTQFSSRASLALIGVLMQQKELWKPVKQHVHIRQKVYDHQPIDKLLDAFINIVAGGHGVVEINTRVRPDRALQHAFGRTSCAEQSVVSDTLNASTEENVTQMRQALQAIYRVQSRGYKHDYTTEWQLLDVDMTGMPTSGHGQGVTKGFFSGQKNRRGRQLGRVAATLYDEIVIERLYSGKVQLERSLQPLVTATEAVLDLCKAQRQQTIIRVDGGGGRDADINWLLQRDYAVLVKVKNWQRAAKLARSVTAWYTDPKTGDRQIGWVTKPHTYARPTRQLAVRTPKKNGDWHYWVIVFSLCDEQVFWLARQQRSANPTSTQILLAALYAYDLRSGGVETTIKGSKQGLGLTRRNKRSFHAQEILVLLAQLAYNMLTWMRAMLGPKTPLLLRFGPLRMVRDLFHIPGKIELNAQGHILETTLSETHPLALPFLQAISSLLAPDEMVLNLGQI